MSLFVMGAIAPQDPVTGVIVGKPWMADRNEPTITQSFRVPQLPLQAGLLVSDAIQELPKRFSVVYTCSEIASTVHPVRSFPQRHRFLAISFNAIVQRKCPVVAWVRGYAPARDLAITGVEHVESLTEGVVKLSVSFERLQFTTLLVVPVAVDVELLAAGIVPL